MKRILSLCAIVLGLVWAGTSPIPAQHTPWLIWTLLPQALMDEIIGEGVHRLVAARYVLLEALEHHRFQVPRDFERFVMRA